MVNLYKLAVDHPLSQEAGILIRDNLMNSGGNPNLLLYPIPDPYTHKLLTDDQFGEIYKNFCKRSGNCRSR